MKQTKVFLLTVVLSVLAFGAVVYTSCRPDRCAGVRCQNGGTCSGGNCICPAGYSGSRCEYLSQTDVDFVNNTYTPVTISIYGYSTATIPAGGTLTFTGTYGDYVTGTAVTAGSTSSGTQLGKLLQWTWTTSDNIYFPSSGYSTVYIDITSDYFFLKMVNNSSQNIHQVSVNYATSAVWTDNVTIPNDGYTYNIGYYNAYSNTQVHAESTSFVWNWFPSIPFNNDPVVTLTAN